MMDDKTLVVIGVVLVMLVCTVFPPPDPVLELIKVGMAGMFGLAMGRGEKRSA
jgi:hypothetical protein